MKIETVDRLRLTIGSQEVRISSRKAKAVLGYLLLNETPTVTRGQLVGLLWSDADEERARGSLRHCIKELRLAFRGTDFDGLDLGKLDISLDPTSVGVDVWKVQEDAKAGNPNGLLLEVPGFTDRLLADIESVDPVFQTWVSARRRSINQSLLRHLEDNLRGAVPDKRHSEDVARAILNQDPTHEEACRHLMRARAAHGDIGGALKIYTALFELLDKEYDVEPTQQTQALFGELKAALPLTGSPARGAAGTMPVTVSQATLPPRTNKLILSIAPFDASPVAPDRRYFVHGFRAELINYLTRFREWSVRERTAGPVQDVLSEEYLLRAETMPSARGARLSLQLSECATNGYLWGDGVVLDSVDWGETQQLLVRRIAAALNIHVSAGRLAQVGPRPSRDLIAYDRWLRGQSEQLTVEPQGVEAAEKLYRELIEQHPEFAPAYSSLAQLRNAVHFVYPGRFRDPSTSSEALRLANEAVRLDPMDSRSQLCLGWANAMAGHHDQAAIHHDLAVELNSSDPWTLVSAALGFALRSDAVMARRLADRAEVLSLSATGTQWRYQAMIRYLIGDFDACLAASAKAAHSIQNVFVWKAASLVELNRLEEARAAADKFFAAVEKRWLNPDLPADRQSMSRWFLHAFPFKSGDDWARLRDNFGRAGAEIQGLQFNTW